jgi:hypothetical protein
MKITESAIRHYIRRLLIETFNVGPDGIAITNQKFREENPELAKTLPADVPQIDRGFPVKLAMAAKEEYEDMKVNNPAMFEKIEQKVFSTAFGFTYDELLENLTFTPSDLKYINIDIKQELSDKSSFNQMMAVLESLMPETAAYLQHLVTATDDFSRDESQMQYTTLDPGESRIFHDDFFGIFFRPPDDPSLLGMGKSLTDYVISNIMSAMLQVQSMTPIEFRDKFYPEFYKIIDIHFQKNPIIRDNAQALKPIRDGYLDSIEFVLTELIAELNFEFLYMGNGQNITSKNPEDLLIFLPDDRAGLAKVATVAQKLADDDGYWKMKDFLADMYRGEDGMVHMSDIPELRSMPGYYDTKFSINPKFKDIAAQEIKNKFDVRLDDNLYFGVGFYNEGVSVPPTYSDYDGVGVLWQKS